MKKSYPMLFCYAIIACCITSFILLINPFSSTVQASTSSQVTALQSLQSKSNELTNEVSVLQENLSLCKESINAVNDRLITLESQSSKTQTLLIHYYLDKLSDPTYVTIYNDDYIYYTAAEQLGVIGKPAISELISRLDTSDDYERALALYALLLASQDKQVLEVTNNEFINVHLDFDARNHPAQVKVALEWWDKYKDCF